MGPHLASTGAYPPPTNEPIAVSGLIAFPPGEVPAGGWPVVSWAHGTVGSTDKSAPSMDPYLEDVPPADADLGLLRKINKVPHALLNAFPAGRLGGGYDRL